MTKFGQALAAVAAVAIIGASSASAQSRIIVGGGSTLGLSDIADDVNGGFSNGPHLIAGYEFVSASGLGVRIDGMYHSIAGNDVGTLSSNLRVINGTANLLYVFKTAGNFKPYLIGGVGYYSYKPTGDAVPDNIESENDFGFNAGAGFEAGNRIKFFGEARFHQIQAEQVDADSFRPRVLPISVGVKLPLGN